MRFLLLLLILPFIYTINYQELYACMSSHSCLNIIGADCEKNQKCWNTLNIRDTCLVQNNCSFPDVEKEYNWECWHCWVGIFSTSQIYNDFLKCVDQFHCSESRLGLWWAIAIMAILFSTML